MVLFLLIPIYRNECALLDHKFSKYAEGETHISISDDINSRHAEGKTHISISDEINSSSVSTLLKSQNNYNKNFNHV